MKQTELKVIIYINEIGFFSSNLDKNITSFGAVALIDEANSGNPQFNFTGSTIKT